MNKCKGCGIELAYYAADSMCGVCRDDTWNDHLNELAEEQRLLDNESKLKVFQITIYKQRKLSELVTDIFLVLASTEEKAVVEVFSEFGYTERVKDHNYHIWEIEGPFGEGSILYRTPQ